MDTELARTFLGLVATGSFSAAAERLHVTQSTVSSRIRTLEQQLGCRLFVRHKSGADLTPEGRRFQRHASLLVRTVEQARHDTGRIPGYRGTVAAGARFALWESVMLDWLSAMRRDHPDIAMRTEVGVDDDLMLGLVEGRLDLAVLYTPQSRPGLVVQHLFADDLVLIGTDPQRRAPAGENHILIDWGAEFLARHKNRFPDMAAPAVNANIGWLALQHLLRQGGTTYLPRRSAGDLAALGKVFIVEEAPRFALDAYAVYPEDADEPLSDGLALLTRLVEDGKGF